MKKKQNFWQSLERYGWVVVRRSPLPYTWVAIGLVVLALGASAGNVKNSVVGATSVRGVIEKAVSIGDYETARELYETSDSMVLGAESELNDLVYPDKKLQREIGRWEELDAHYPSNREIMRGLASLYEQAGDNDKASELREQIRILDPNGN